MKMPIGSQIAEVQREIALRRNTYPRLLSVGKMRRAEADLCMARMEAVLKTLMFCQEHEQAFREWMAERRDEGGEK